MPAGTNRDLNRPLLRALVLSASWLPHSCARIGLCVTRYHIGSNHCTLYMTRTRGPGGATIAALSLDGRVHRYTRDMLGMSLCDKRLITRRVKK